MGIFAGNAWRVGLIGDSSNEQNVLLLLNALEKLLIEYGHSVKRGTAVQAASQVF